MFISYPVPERGLREWKLSRDIKAEAEEKLWEKSLEETWEKFWVVERQIWVYFCGRGIVV